jgi:hypothetical protein
VYLFSTGDEMADDNSGLMAEFEEFLKAKQESQKEEADSEDFEVEIFDEKGRGVRTRRSHAKPFLQSLGLDPDPEPPADDKDKDKKDPPKGKKATPPQNNSVARKYFVKK